MDLKRLGMRMMGSCEHCNVPLGSIKDRIYWPIEWVNSSRSTVPHRVSYLWNWFLGTSATLNDVSSDIINPQLAAPWMKHWPFRPVSL